MRAVFMLTILTSSSLALAGDWANTCEAMAMQEQWQCDGTFHSADMQLFCQANVMLDADQNLYCPKIQDPDLQHFCNATSQLEASECSAIVSADMKNACM